MSIGGERGGGRHQSRSGASNDAYVCSFAVFPPEHSALRGWRAAKVCRRLFVHRCGALASSYKDINTGEKPIMGKVLSDLHRVARDDFSAQRRGDLSIHVYPLALPTGNEGAALPTKASPEGQNLNNSGMINPKKLRNSPAGLYLGQWPTAAYHSATINRKGVAAATHVVTCSAHTSFRVAGRAPDAPLEEVRRVKIGWGRGHTHTHNFRFQNCKIRKERARNFNARTTPSKNEERRRGQHSGEVFSNSVER